MSCTSTPGCSPGGASWAIDCWPGRARRRSIRRGGAKAPLTKGGTYITLHGLKDEHARPLRPDDLLEVETNKEARRPFLIEYDRTRRVDKNFAKFRRYDTFLCWWRLETALADQAPPYVLFIYQDTEHLDLFVDAADRELTGHRSHAAAMTTPDDFVGRRQLVFAEEAAMHRGEAPTACRLIRRATRGGLTRTRSCDPRTCQAPRRTVAA